MTDRELLELAAKAFGLEMGKAQEGFWFYSEHGQHGEGIYRIHGNMFEPWNPLTDDGDALRLAVKLDMDIVYDFDRVMAVFGNKNDTCITEYFYDLPQPTDRYAATRRAIVRAAAEIGRNKNG